MQQMRRAVRLLSAFHGVRRRKPPEWSAAERRDRRRTSGWGWSSDIRGIGVGDKRVNNRSTGVPCITLYVRHKRPVGKLAAIERIPRHLTLESLGVTVETDVIELKHQPEGHSAADIRPGYQVAHETGSPGTLGVLVRRIGDAAVLAMSCSHVLARGGTLGTAGDIVETPYSFSSPASANEFGRLTSSFTRLKTTGVFQDDFALAEVDVPYGLKIFPKGPKILDVYPASAGFAPGLKTDLRGDISNAVTGAVTNPSWSGDVKIPDVGLVYFDGLIPYKTKCQPGDSGAPVLKLGTNTILGLHVGGSSADQFGLFMPLSPLFATEKLELILD